MAKKFICKFGTQLDKNVLGKIDFLMYFFVPWFIQK